MKTRFYPFAKRLLSLLFALLLLAGTLSAVSASEPPAKPKNIKSCSVYNVESETLIYEKSTSFQLYPGPTAKLMTAILAAEQLSNRLDDSVMVSAAMVTGIMGNTLKLKIGEYVTIRDMLYALILYGANDAAQVLAITVAGSIKGFTALMNQRVKELGAESTWFENPTGLEIDSAKSTTADIMKLAAHAYSLPVLADIFSSTSYTMAATNRSEARTFSIKNQFATTGSAYYYSGAQHLCFGSTTPAGTCMVVAVKQGSLTYLCVVMGGKDAASVYKAADTVLDYAFREYVSKPILTSLTVLGEVPVKNGENGHVTFSPQETVSVFAQRDEEVASRVRTEVHADLTPLYAPVKEGVCVGYADVYFDEEPVARVDLYLDYDVDQSAWLYFWYTVVEFLWTPSVMLILAGALIAAALFFFLSHRQRSRPERRDDADLRP